MAFNGFSRKTWTDRVSEYPTRRILTDTTSQATQQVTVSRDEGTVTSQGDTFDAETMNNLEARIASSFTEDEAAIGNLTNLTTTEKTNLVGALNEVKASVPPLVDELNDLDDVSISPATAGSGDTLIFNSGTLKWEDGQLQAAQVGFTPDTVSTSMPSGFTDVQKAVDYVCELADDVKASKADIQDPEFIGNPTAPTQAKGNSSTRLATTAFVNTEIDNDTKYHAGDSFSVAGTTCIFLQTGTSCRITIPLCKPVGSDVTAAVNSGNWEIRDCNGSTTNGDKTTSGHPLSYYVTTPSSDVKVNIGTNTINIQLTNLKASTWGSTSRYTVGSAYANNGNSITFS